jgi:6-phosphogluconolactonase
MLRVFDDLGPLSDAAARYIASCAEEAFKEAGEFHWLLCGGSTPRTTYRLLAGNPYGGRGFWLRTHFYWGDERCVSPYSEQSNYHQAKESLLDLITTSDVQIHRIPADAPDREAAAAVYEVILPARPDLVLLGMGEEGHTASLFPHSRALDETRRRVMHVVAPDYTVPRDRLTITPPVLRAAAKTLVLVEGKNKAEALEKVFRPDGDIHETPARLVRDADWFVDRAAARLVLKMDQGKRIQVHTE